MNKASRVFILAGIILFVFAACKSNGGTVNSANTGTVTAAAAADRSAPLLYTKWPFMVGAAAPADAFDRNNGQYKLLKHFEVLSAENDLTPVSILPQGGEGDYGWTGADRLVNYARASNVKIRGHVLFSHNHTPDWFFKGTGKEGRATKEELYARMEQHARAVFKKYGGKIIAWDVLSEAVDSRGPRPAAGSPYTAIMEDSRLTGVNRYEYALKAFQWARQYADANGGRNVRLYLNDYDIEVPGGKQSEFSRLVDYLIQNDAPIDGIGMQCHIRWDYPGVSQIAGAIDLFSAKTRKDGVKLKVQITSLDMSVFSNNETSSYESGRFLLTLPDAARDSRMTRQTEKYRELFDMFAVKHKEGKLDMVMLWGLADGHSYLNNYPAGGRTDYPLLFDREYRPKAAFWALVN